LIDQAFAIEISIYLRRFGDVILSTGKSCYRGKNPFWEGLNPIINHSLTAWMFSMPWAETLAQLICNPCLVYRKPRIHTEFDIVQINGDSEDCGEFPVSKIRFL
jgi:hypothetical protein